MIELDPYEKGVVMSALALISGKLGEYVIRVTDESTTTTFKVAKTLNYKVN